MTNAKLIDSLRNVYGEKADCYHCHSNMGCYGTACMEYLCHAAADALEAARMELTTKCRRLEAQLPKEGEWIRKEVKVYCPRDCWNPSACAIEGTWNEEEGWNLEMQDGFCSVCGEQDDQYYKDKYCPNCGARMQTVTNCHTLEEGER